MSDAPRDFQSKKQISDFSDVFIVGIVKQEERIQNFCDSICRIK